MRASLDRGSPPLRRVLIVGVSVRAAADSAARAGYAVTALDAFGDLDQHALANAIALPRDLGVRFTARAAARAARGVACDAVVYQSNFENYPAAVRALAAGRTLWGNTPRVLARVRDPELLARVLGLRGFAAPQVRHAAPPDAADAHRRWVVKPRASGGGHGVRPWRRAAALPRGCYLQEHIEGTPGSVVFVADGHRAVALGMSRQLVGDPAFGAAGMRYCGSILAGSGDPQFVRDSALLGAACALAGAVSEEFGLVGVNGIDFIARNGVPFTIEVNPRYSASMELVERAYGVSVFGAHARACDGGALPDFDLARGRHGAGAVGKAIVFARRDVRAGDTRPWLADPSVRDVPRPGERIPRGGPVCTVFAAGSDAFSCHAALVRRAGRVYDELAAWERIVA